MPSQDGKVTILVENNAQKASADFQQLNKSLSDTGSAGKSAVAGTDKLGGAISGLKNVVMGAGVALVGMKLLEYGKQAMTVASEFEQLNVSFSVMAGQQAGAQLVKDLTALANVTPMTTQSLADNARTLLAFGEASQNIIPDLKLLGDISGGNAEKMRMLTLAFSQIGSTGRLMGQDLLQLVNAGFNPLQVISDKTGKSMGELKKEMENGQISFSMIKQAMIDVTSEGGRFYGMMEKQSKTLEGTLSTMQDKWALVSKEIGDTFLPMTKRAVNAMTSMADATLNTIKWLKSEQSTLMGLKASWDQYWASKRHSKAEIVFDFSPYLKKQREMEKATSKIATPSTKKINMGFADSASTGKTAKTKKASQATEYDKLTQKINVLQDKLRMMAIHGQEGTIAFAKGKEELTKYTLAMENANKAIEIHTGSYDGLNAKMADAQKKMQDLASAKVVNKDEFEKAKADATALAIKLKEVNQAIQLNLTPYDALSTKITTLQQQLQNMILTGQKGTTDYNKVKNAYVEALNTMKQVNTSVANAVGVDWSNIGQSIKTELSSALTTPLQAGESAFTRFGNVAMNVLGMVAQKLIETFVIDKAVTGIANMFTGGFGGSLMSLFTSANGNVFQGGKILPHANGGVVSSMTAFPMAGGNIGTMAEGNKPEAIMPLSRGANGKLGVHATGSNANINIYNQSNSQIETVKRPNGDTDLFIRKVNNALSSERTNAGFSKAVQRQQSRGVQAS